MENLIPEELHSLVVIVIVLSLLLVVNTANMLLTENKRLRARVAELEAGRKEEL